jgi:ADP-heptose:LPS heptosyltransferase
LISTSCKDVASEVLAGCLAGQAPAQLPRALAEEPCGRALFGILAEGLADRFEPSLCNAYARLFSQAIAYAMPRVDASGLVARYERVRRVRRVLGRPRRIFVLSRVTLGADVAVTSVLLAAAKTHVPHAEVCFVGPSKNYELFAGDRHIHHIPIEYRRGGLRERLAVWEALESALNAPEAVVIDPDSRLTQLGLLPLGEEERYHLFESRSYGGSSASALPELAASWAVETLGGAPARPYIALAHTAHSTPSIAISLGVGENPLKRIPDPFEEELLRMLASTGFDLVIDAGAGGEEAQRVSRALERSGARATVWSGSFAGFAELIAASRLYVGYDSAGQHVAAACGVPLISVFAGFPCQRMFERWRPIGPGCTVIRAESRDPAECLTRVKEALAGVLEATGPVISRKN